MERLPTDIRPQLKLLRIRCIRQTLKAHRSMTTRHEHMFRLILITHHTNLHIQRPRTLRPNRPRLHVLYPLRGIRRFGLVRGARKATALFGAGRGAGRGRTRDHRSLNASVFHFAIHVHTYIGPRPLINTIAAPQNSRG